ncbi:hypothetical protein EV284_2943 [Streptomyces sp. BK022]|nr:hypothetical protein EV284_2943 [Streptomyces sp. BK022]
MRNANSGQYARYGSVSPLPRYVTLRGSANMENGAVPARALTPHPKLTIKVYTVTREGVVTAPRATVSVPHDMDRRPTELMSGSMPPCQCPVHRMPGAAR